MKKLIFTIIAIFAIYNSVSAQSVYVNVQDWGVPNIYLLDGKIKYESNTGETTFNTSVKFKRFDGSTQVRAQAIYVLDANGSETAISDSIVVNTADFTQASGIYWSKEFVKTAKLQPNNKNGIVKLKWRYLDTYSGTNTRWSSYYYASKTYQTVENIASKLNDGDFVKNTSTLQVYFKFEGKLRHIESLQTLQGLFVIQDDQIKKFTNEQLSAITKGTPLAIDNGLVHDVSTGKVYLREGKTIRHISSIEVFNKYKFNMDALQNVSSLSSYTLLNPIY